MLVKQEKGEKKTPPKKKHEEKLISIMNSYEFQLVAFTLLFFLTLHH